MGKVSDAEIGRRFGISEPAVRYHRIKLGLSTFRSTRAAISVPCANCGDPTPRKQRDTRRSRRLFCSRTCADAGQKKRDSETLRYGPGWKNTKARIRARDTVCRICGKTPAENGSALHVHHLKPYRLGGSNHPENLVALCDSCHHTIEAITTSTLNSIPIVVSLDGSCLTVKLDGRVLWHGSVLGAACPPASGSTL